MLKLVLTAIAGVLLAGCERGADTLPRELEQLYWRDIPFPQGDWCALSAGVGQIVMVAAGPEAVVRVDGRPIRLRTAASDIRRGAVFASDEVDVAIVPAAAEHTGYRMNVRVLVRREEAADVFEATWRC